MLNTLKHRITQPGYFAGVEVCLRGAALSYQLVVLKRLKDSVQIHLQKKEIEDFATLETLLSKDWPIHLTLSGRGILHKKLPTSNQSTDQLFKSVLPNADIRQFQLHKIESAEGLIVSLARLDIIQQHTQQLSDAGYWPVALSLGNFDLRYLHHFLNITTPIGTSTQLLQLNADGQIIDFKSLSEPKNQLVNLGDDRLDSVLLPAYAGALKGLMGLEDASNLVSLSENKKEYFHFSLHKKISIGLLAGLFILLLGNTFFYYQLKDQSSALQTDLFYKRSQLTELDSLKKRLQQQQLFLKQSNLNSYSNSSFYADQIGVSLPKGLRLTELTIYPAKAQIKKQREEDWVQYEHSQIKVKGHCKSSLQYNSWINHLRQLAWVHSVDHLNYRDINQELGSFESLINLSPSKKFVGSR